MVISFLALPPAFLLEGNFLVHSECDVPGKEPYLFPEVLPIVPRAGGAAGVLTAGAGKGQLAAAAATAGTEVTGEGNP